MSALDEARHAGRASRMRLDFLTGAAALALSNGLNAIIAEQERYAKLAGEQGKSASLSETARAYMQDQERQAFAVIRELSQLRATAMGRHFAALKLMRAAQPVRRS